MAEHAFSDRGNAGDCPMVSANMAVETIESKPDVFAVRKCNRLVCSTRNGAQDDKARGFSDKGDKRSWSPVKQCLAPTLLRSGLEKRRKLLVPVWAEMYRDSLSHC
jgi:hypothetical protein